MAIEIVDFPIKHGDFPWLCKRLPEGNDIPNVYLMIYIDLNGHEQIWPL